MLDNSVQAEGLELSNGCDTVKRDLEMVPSVPRAIPKSLVKMWEPTFLTVVADKKLQ